MTTPTTDPAETIAQIHTSGEALGFERTRVDRQQLGGLPHRPAAWFEVGYGSGEITIRHSYVPDWPVGRLKFALARIDWSEVQALLLAVRESADEQEVTST